MTTLTHKPAHSVNYPDRFEDPATHEGYAVRQDCDAEDPRQRYDTAHVALWAYREPPLGGGSRAAIKPEGNLAIDAFAHFFHHVGYQETKALRLTQRWLRIFYPEQKIELAIQTLRGYSQGDWLDVICAVVDGYGTPQGHLDEFKQWVNGDVWVVIPDGGAGISGIYAGSPAEALQHFRENYEDAVFTHQIELKIAAADAAAAQRAIEEIVTSLQPLDHQWPRVTVQSFSASTLNIPKQREV